MASPAKKEYTLTINGIDRNIKETTSLRDMLDSLDKTIGRVNTTMASLNKSNSTATSTTREKAKALTDEEKAQRRLESTLSRISNVESDLNRAQIEANQELRNRTREVTLQVQAQNAAANSIQSMSLEVSRLREEWSRTDVDSERFTELTDEIATLTERINEARQASGDFRGNVGNYESAFNGLTKGLETLNRTGLGITQTFLGGNTALRLFGAGTEELTSQAKNLQSIIQILNIAQQVNTNLLKQNLDQNRQSLVLDRVRAVQLRAKAAAEALATKNTIAATVAQRAFNLVARANPYVLIASAILSVIGAIALYITRTREATAETDRHALALERLQRAYSQSETYIRRSAELFRAQTDNQEEILRNTISLYSQEISNFQNQMNRLTGFGNRTREDLNEQQREQYDELDKIISEYYNRREEAGHQYNLYLIQEQQRRDKEEKETAQKQANDLIEITRTAQDVQTSLITNEYERRRQQINNSYDRQIDDYRKRIEQETTLTQEVRSRINDIITGLENARRQELNTIWRESQAEQAERQKEQLESQREAAERELELTRQAEDSRTSLILNEFDRRRIEINNKYARENEDLNRHLQEAKDLTTAQQEAIREIILNNETARQRELQDLRLQENERWFNIQVEQWANYEREIRQRIGEMEVRDDNGLINVDQTRNNLSQVNDLLDSYIANLRDRKNQVAASFRELLSGLQEGTPQYEEALNRYQDAMLDYTEMISDALKEQEENTKTSTGLQNQYYQELYEKIGEEINKYLQVFTSFIDTLNMGLEMQIESLNEKLEETTKRYDEAVALREKSTEQIESLEERLRNASGTTAAVIRAQLDDEIQNRNRLARKEQQLAREKEKREEQIAKKEKQVKRNTVLSNIAQAIANTALGVTAALPDLILAAFVGSIGAAQVGIMTAQLAKLEDGGLINGPSHKNGGARIQGTNIEVEGGEYVINRQSTQANMALVDFINSSRRQVTAADILGIIPDNSSTPVMVSDRAEKSEDRILSAIENINFQPVVAVTDIIEQNDEVVGVRDISGF